MYIFEYRGYRYDCDDMTASIERSSRFLPRNVNQSERVLARDRGGSKDDIRPLPSRPRAAWAAWAACTYAARSRRSRKRRRWRSPGSSAG